MLAVAAEIIEEQGLRANGLVFGVYAGSRSLEQCCGFCKRRVNDAEHNNQSTVIECPLYANVELLVVLEDVPMQTCVGVMDEVARWLNTWRLMFPRPPLKHFDVTRSTHTDLDVLQEKRIDDNWNVDSNRSLSDSWKELTIRTEVCQILGKDSQNSHY